jgi:hypothetical protein
MRQIYGLAEGPLASLGPLLKDRRLPASGRAVIPIQFTRLSSEGRTSAFSGPYDIGLLCSCYVKNLRASITFANIGCSVCSCLLRSSRYMALKTHTDSGKYW